MEDFVSHWDCVRPPPHIQAPEEYDGSPSICIACTQTDLKPSQQSALVARWCKLLPTLSHVERAWFVTQMPQRLFDAACKMPALSDLWIKWSAIKDLSAITHATGLRHFYLGSSAQVQSLDSLARLPQLETLHLMNTKKVRDIRFVTSLRKLREFGFTSDIFGRADVESLAPLAEIKPLVHVDLRGTWAADQSLRPLATLPALQDLTLTNDWPLAEYAYLRVHAPQLRDMLEAVDAVDSDYFNQCRKCKKRSMVSPTGRGKKKWCRTCDAAALQAHCEAYAALVQEFENARTA